MTKKPKNGTLSTRMKSDKVVTPPKETDIIGKIKVLLGLNKIRFLPHANQRMGERNVIDYEVRQALHKGIRDPARDRYSSQFNSWEYSIEGHTKDERLLRIGISFETGGKNGEKLLIITVIDPGK